ncbi:MAG TPA: DUF882 domain-containing protein [Patescibacteria group bacterium]|nr:DUF882 domain-containing protein [Patescibacteria group bacterium]
MKAKSLVKAGLALTLAFNLAACATNSPPTPEQQDNAAAPADSVVTHGARLQPAVFVIPAASQAAAARTDTLRFRNLHTDEAITVTRQRGQSITREANWFMRDFRRGEIADMDPALFDLLGRLKTAIQRRHPGLDVVFEVISPYRAPETNDSLRAAGGGQADNSQHTQGKAIDIRVPGLTTRELRDIATLLQGGGVGYYAEDQFVHVDTGRVRYWPSHDYLATLRR